MKSMTDLWRELASELASWCCTSTAQDYKKLLSRTEKEGLSFLTITLPSFGKDFESCLENGLVDDSSFAGFKRKNGLPLFLGGFLRQVFCPSDGVLLDQPCKDSIFAIRQLTLMFAKILLPCSDARVADAFWGYIKCEQDLLDWESRDSFDVESFERVSNLLLVDVLSKADELIYKGEIVPGHGPGKTADQISGNHKFDLTTWPSRLESVFPFGEYGIPNWRYHNRYEQLEICEPDMEVPVKVTAVPKTLSTPRIIAIEPTCMQYMQQAILKMIVELLESQVIEGYTRDNLASHFLGFTDQDPNRVLAKRGSEVEGQLATLDLSEASDRVHVAHVVAMLGRFPFLREGVMACRSTKARVPAIGVDVYSLRKFASMGSALCFPFEAMVFLTAIFLGIEAQLGHRLTRKDVSSFVGKVRVYGDDIIVPVEYVHSVIESLARLGFKVNTRKSFWNGMFRESCGGDYYDGTDVTPVRVRRIFPEDRRDVAEVESMVALRNHLYERGLWRTTGWLDVQIARVLPHFPIAEPTSSGLCRRSFLPYKAERLDGDTQSPRVRAYVSTTKPPPSRASGIGSLLKCLMSGPGETLLDFPLSMREPSFMDAKHLQRSGRSSDADIKLRWISPF